MLAFLGILIIAEIVLAITVWVMFLYKRNNFWLNIFCVLCFILVATTTVPTFIAEFTYLIRELMGVL